MQGARIWLPNIEEFFTSLGRLLVTGGDWTQTLCVARRMKLTTNESQVVVIYCKIKKGVNKHGEWDSNVMIHVSIMEQ